MGNLHKESTDIMHGRRIDGAERLGHQWVIPINAEKPKDARIKRRQIH